MEKPNFNYIEQLSAGDDGFKQELVAIIKKEFPIDEEAYNTSIQNDEYKKAASSVHKLKHKISILGLEKGYKLATEYEFNLNNNSTQLKTNFENLLTNMRGIIDKL